LRLSDGNRVELQIKRLRLALPRARVWPSLGPDFYPATVVDDWEEGINADLYINAMESGEVFVIATGEIQGVAAVLGLRATTRLRTHGATRIRVEASLAGVEFYRANGFIELDRGVTRLMSGKPIACVFMQKALST
jgi:hypothetical protein